MTALIKIIDGGELTNDKSVLKTEIELHSDFIRPRLINKYFVIEDIKPDFLAELLLHFSNFKVEFKIKVVGKL